jgi:hypothetical protein
MMSDQPRDTARDDDVEGHLVESDDVQGHGRAGRADAGVSDDDTEGHIARVKADAEGTGDEDAEGHGWRMS